MTNYQNINITPIIVVIVGYTYLTIVATILYCTDFMKGNDFFRWGVPVKILGKEVNNLSTFYAIWVVVFLNQFIQTAFTEIVYSWMLNCVQDPKSKDTIYSKKISIMLVALNSIYYSIHMLCSITSIMTQFSFFIANFLGGFIVVIYTNWNYILRVHSNRLNLNQYESL